jgi:hypothetical protein
MLQELSVVLVALALLQLCAQDHLSPIAAAAVVAVLLRRLLARVALVVVVLVHFVDQTARLAL